MSNGLCPSRGRNRMKFSLFDRHCLFGLCCVVLHDGDDHRGWIFLRGGPSRLCPCDGVCALGGGSSSDTLFTILFCFGSSACHGFEWDLSLLHDFFCSFFSSSLLLFARSDMQYSCIISNSFVTVFGLHRDMYSPYGPRLIPFHRIDDALVSNIRCSCAKLHDTLKIFLQGHASLP